MSSSQAQQLLQQGRLQEAEQAARSALQRSSSDVDALNVLGLVALRGGDTRGARQWLERAIQVDPRHALAHHYLGRVHDAEGNPEAAAAAHGNAINLTPELFIVRLHLGASLERGGADQQAAVQYLRALQDAQAQGRWLNSETTAATIRPMVQHAVQFVKQTRRAALARLMEPLLSKYGPDSMRRVEHALRIYFLEEAAISPDERQKPTFLYFPGLPAAAYLDRSLFSWIDALEAQTGAIRAELLDLMPSGAGRERVFTSEEIERQNLRGVGAPPSWNGYYFYRHGVRRDDNCASCPRTAQALGQLPLSHVREHGPEVLFSVFTPGTHLLPHRGVTNTRLVAHLPLIVPRECALNVGGELHAWQEGRVVVFDDTYEHEAWNRSSEIRVVMIFDIWNPHLTQAECAAIAELVPAMGDFRKAVEAA